MLQRQFEKQLNRVLSAETDKDKAKAQRRLAELSARQAFEKHEDRKKERTEEQLVKLRKEVMDAVLGCISTWPEQVKSAAVTLATGLAAASLTKGPVWAVQAVLHRLRDVVHQRCVQAKAAAQKEAGTKLHQVRSKALADQKATRKQIAEEIASLPAEKKRMLREEELKIDLYIMSRTKVLQAQLASMDDQLKEKLKAISSRHEDTSKSVEEQAAFDLQLITQLESRYGEFSRVIESVLKVEEGSSGSQKAAALQT
jgi:transcriptional regulator of heat shock response